MRMEKNGSKWHRLGTWNIRCINGKENELINEIEKYKIGKLAITETTQK